MSHALLVAASCVKTEKILWSRGRTSIIKVRVGRVMSSSHLSVQDLMLASECLIISRTVNPEGPACMATAFLQLRLNDINAESWQHTDL